MSSVSDLIRTDDLLEMVSRGAIFTEFDNATQQWHYFNNTVEGGVTLDMADLAERGLIEKGEYEVSGIYRVNLSVKGVIWKMGEY